jgi:hypothetical protein
MDGNHTALLKAAVQAELAGLLARHGFASSSARAEAFVAGRDIRLPLDATPRQLGEQIGRSLYAAF